MKKIVIIILLTCMGFSCTQIEEEFVAQSSDSENDSAIAVQTRSETSTVFDTLPNPYALDVMQTVYTSSGSNITLQPTDLYVRFLPQDSLQMSMLNDNYGLELFNYPLDLDIGEDEVYLDTTIPEGQFMWQYTTVKPDFEFPEDINYEILEYCYLPEEDEVIATTRGGEIDVEKAAFEMLGYTIEPETRALFERPKGKITVYDDSAGKYVPVKGVKIRCHTVVRWSTTFTNENGDYSMDSKFMIGPHYAIVFDNSKGFDIWGNWGPLARANYNMGWHSKKGYSKEIPTSSQAWDWAAVNNAGYEYYKMCEQTGITKPPSDLKIWVFKGWGTSSAPMIRRVYHPIGLNGNSPWINFFANLGGYGSVATAIVDVLRIVMPDVTIGTKNKTYRDVYEVVNHELSHASHFSKVGSAYWAKYISYIMTYGAYGSGNGNNAELCGVGEMWGYAMGHIQECEKYEPAKLNYPDSHDWLKPHVIWNLVTKTVLTKKEIYDCLSSDVDTYYKLIEKMYQKYPSKADLIEAAFVNNGIIRNVPKPSGTTNFINQTVKTNTNVAGNIILVQNVSVNSPAKLTFKPQKSITINSPFTVNSGSKLEISF